MENQNENDPINNDPRPPESFVPPTGEQSQPTTQTAQPAEQPTNSTYAQPAPEPIAPQAPNSKKWLLPTVLIAAIVVVLVGSGVAAFVYLQNKPSSTVGSNTDGNCTHTAAPLTASSAKSAYKAFVNVLKSGDQTCADELSTDIFQIVHAQTYTAPDGKWLSKAGVLSAVADFKKLPSELDAEKLSTADYIRADYSAYPGVTDTSQPEGMTVKCTVKSDGGYDLHLNLSFVELNNEILVDEMVVVPASIDK